ncbi:MAG: phosphate signaling complex protein PhoU [Mycobacteriales bacterium]
MRDAYHEELDAIVRDLAEMTNSVSNAMSSATTALLDADLQLAQKVIEEDELIDKSYHEIESRALDLLARQQPVASDLRIIVTSLRMVADIERAGDLALHVAKVARRRYPLSSVPPQMRTTILEMGQIAQLIMTKCGDVIRTQDIALAHELEADDDVMDALHRRIFGQILEQEVGLEVAIDITLIGRYYERFADHAVSIARRVVFLVTGERVT